MLAAWCAVAGAGCSSYLGSARAFDPAGLEEPGWIAARGVTYIAQQEEMDCGAAAMAMVLVHWKAASGFEDVRASMKFDADAGANVGEMRKTARGRGLEAFLIEGDFRVFEKELSRKRPVIVGMVKRHLHGFFTHYEVVVGYHPERKLVVTLDPGAGWRVNDETGFLEEWEPAKRLTLVIFRKEP
jgi:ATP-binding cassette subfamily C protein/competence factor transporting protein